MNYRKSSPTIIKAWFSYKNNNKGLSFSVSSFVAGYNAAKHDIQTTGLYCPYCGELNANHLITERGGACEAPTPNELA